MRSGIILHRATAIREGGMETTLVVFAFIRQYLAAHPWSPSLREIAEGCGFAWPSSVVRHLERLEGWGLIVREPGQARGIALTEKGRQFQI
jgi:repressor LexA